MKKPSLHSDIRKFIKVIRASFHDSVLVYRYGACYGFFKILKKIFPSAQPYFSNEEKKHIVSKIKGRFYDIKGEFSFGDDEIPKKLSVRDREVWESVADGQRLEIMLAKYTDHNRKISEGK